jgi:hypothetical protein
LVLDESEPQAMDEFSTTLVPHLPNNPTLYLPEFSSAALSSVDVATATPPSSALHMKNSFCV